MFLLTRIFIQKLLLSVLLLIPASSQIIPFAEIAKAIEGVKNRDISSMLHLGKIGLGVVETLESIFTEVFFGTSIDYNIFEKSGSDQHLLSLYEVLTIRLDQIHDQISEIQSDLRALGKDLPNIVRWETAMNTLETNINSLNHLYLLFLKYQKNKRDIENATLLDFAKTVVSHHTTSVRNLMENIHRSSIFNMLEEVLNSYGICNQKSTPQQLIFGLYTTLAITQAQGFAMSSFSYNMLQYFDKGKFSSEHQLVKNMYMNYSKALFRIGLHSIEGASTFYRKCDPVEHIENETYVQVTELIQGYIVNEVDLRRKSLCSWTCGDYKHVKVLGCYEAKQTDYCGRHKRCNGEVHDCQFFGDSNACLSSQPHRRYDWVEKCSSLGYYGQEKYECNNIMKMYLFWSWGDNCDYCMCYCDDASSPTSERYISLRPAVSDIANNKVVSGLRFVKKQKMIHIEVMEAVAKAQGQIDSVTSRWVDAEAMAIETNEFKEGEDYHTLNYAARYVDLDRLMAPKGHVVTGVRFRMLRSNNNLEVRITPINFTSGVLEAKMSSWISKNNTIWTVEDPRKELHLYEPDISINDKSGSEEISTSNMFVQLQPTSLHADVGQLTVPFFDAQPVSTSPTTWLEGVEIYHRGRKGYGGFLAFQIFNYNLSRHLQDDQI